MRFLVQHHLTINFPFFYHYFLTGWELLFQVLVTHCPVLSIPPSLNFNAVQGRELGKFPSVINMQNIRQPQLVLYHIEAVLYNKWRSRHFSYANYLILQHELIYSVFELKNPSTTIARIRARNLAIFVLAPGHFFENAVTRQWKFHIFKSFTYTRKSLFRL